MAAILIVDDDRSVLELMTVALEADGHEVTVCGDGASALELLHRDQLPDLVVLDWMMPELDGLTVATEIRGHERTESIPIIMLTARLDGEAEALAAGADVYMTKPFDPRMLEANIDLLLSFPRQSAGPRAIPR